MYTSFLNRNDLTRGLRNNNPGNLVYTSIGWNGKIPLEKNTDWSGTPSNIKKQFEQFIELRYGIRALMRDLINDHKKGKKSVVDLISEFAPAFENQTQAYINTVIKNIGMSIVNELTEDVLLKLCKAIIRVENGKDAALITDKDYQDAINILGLPLKKKVA